jgi:hypothetical protein
MLTRTRQILVAVAALLISSAQALAQCAMCKASIEGSPDAVAAAHGLNLAVLVLLIPPVAAFVGIFAIFYRYRNAHTRPSSTQHSALPD